MRNVRPEDGSRMLVMNLGCSPQVKQRGEVGCRAAFFARTECREEPAGKLKDGHPYRGVWRRGSITPA